MLPMYARRDEDERHGSCDPCNPRQGPRKAKRGDTIIFPFQVVTIGPGGGASPRNITGWAFWCTVKRTNSDPDRIAVAQVTLTTSVPAGGGIQIVNALAGQGQVTIPAIATRGFPSGIVRLLYDIQGQDPGGNIFTVEENELEISPDITNAIGAYAGGGNWPPAPFRPVPVVNAASSPWVIDPQDRLVEFDGSDGMQAVAKLPPNPTIGEEHEFVQTKWTGSTPPPVVNFNGRQGTPYGQLVVVSGAAVASTAITDFGGRARWKWDGSLWIGL